MTKKSQFNFNSPAVLDEDADSNEEREINLMQIGVDNLEDLSEVRNEIEKNASPGRQLLAV